MVKVKTAAMLLSFNLLLFGQTLVEPPYLHSYGIRKATPAALFMFFGPITAFSEPEGIATVKMNSRNDPLTEKDDDEVVVYGVNSGKNQLIYNTSMWSLALYGKAGAGQGCFSHPTGIAIDETGNVFVADKGNNRIVHLFNPKQKVRWVSAFSGKSKNDSGLNAPQQVGLDLDGRIYVSDFNNQRIVIFNKQEVVEKTISGDEKIKFENGPSMLAVADGNNNWSYFKNERCFICADRFGTRLWKINFNGTVEKHIIMPSGYVAGYGAVDFYHNLWITDKLHNCILKFDHTLQFLDVFGSYGNGKDQFIEPRGIAIWKRYGQTFIAEKNGAQYFWIGTDCKAKNLRKNPDNTYTLSLNVTEYSFVSLFSVQQKDTEWFLNRTMILPGNQKVTYSQKTGIAKFSNQFIVRVEPTYSSFSYTKLEFPISIEK